MVAADGVKFIKNPDGTVALEIPNCKPSDAGKYTLRAKNPDGGAAESSAPVEGNDYDPRIPKGARTHPDLGCDF